MRRKSINSAQYVIMKFGGVRAMARAIGRSPSAVCSWQKSGRIPSNLQAHIIDVANEHGIHLTPRHLIYGG